MHESQHRCNRNGGPGGGRTGDEPRISGNARAATGPARGLDPQAPKRCRYGTHVLLQEASSASGNLHSGFSTLCGGWCRHTAAPRRAFVRRPLACPCTQKRAARLYLRRAKSPRMRCAEKGASWSADANDYATKDTHQILVTRMRNEGHRVRAFAANFPQFHNGPLTLCAPQSAQRRRRAACCTPQWPRPQRKTLACCASPGSPVRPHARAAERKRLSDLGVA